MPVGARKNGGKGKMMISAVLFWLMLQGEEVFIEGPSPKAKVDEDPGQPRRRVCCSSPRREVLEHLAASMVAAGRAKLRA